MPAIVYPASLPEPAAFPFSPRERRVASPQPGLTELRARAREQIVDAKGARWIYTPEQMEVWRAWFKNTLRNGQCWFAVTLPGRGGWQTRVARYVSGTVREHKGAGCFEVSADLEINGSRAAPLLSFGGIDLDAIANAGTTYTVGIAAIGLDPDEIYTVTLPAGRLYTAWAFQNPPLWTTKFSVRTDDGTDTEYSNSATYATAEEARAAFVPVELTGSSTYWFYLHDTELPDNRGGLSILLV